MSKLKFEVDLSCFWDAYGDENLSDAIQRIVRDACKNEVRKHIKVLLTKRRSDTTKEVASALKAELEELTNRPSNCTEERGR